MALCPRCQQPLPDPPERFCPHCGAELSPVVRSTPWEQRDPIGLVSALVGKAQPGFTRPTEGLRRARLALPARSLLRHADLRHLQPHPHDRGPVGGARDRKGKGGRGGATPAVLPLLLLRGRHRPRRRGPGVGAGQPEVSASAIVGTEATPARTTLRARPGGVPVGAILAACGLVAIGTIAVLHLDRLPFSLCVFKAVTGLPCMTSGTTRPLARPPRLAPGAAPAPEPPLAARPS